MEAAGRSSPYGKKRFSNEFLTEARAGIIQYPARRVSIRGARARWTACLV